MTTQNSHLPPALVANLQNVLAGRKVQGNGQGMPTVSSSTVTRETNSSPGSSSGTVILVTSCGGGGGPGLTALVDAIVSDGRFDVYVCTPESEKPLSGHSMTIGETVAASSVEINGATAAFEITGTPADCVSLAMSGALFACAKPTLVISGINRGSNYGNHIFSSGAVAGAREALMWGVPSLCISLNWNTDESQDKSFKDAADVCLPLIRTAIRDAEMGVFPKGCLLSISIPTSPSTIKGFKVTRQSLWRTKPFWEAVSRNRHHSMPQHQGLGFQLAQLGRDASAAGAARRLNSQEKTLEIESTAASGKTNARHGTESKYFRLEFLDEQHDDPEDDLDFKALEDGFVAVSPVYLSPQVKSEAFLSLSEWLSSALESAKENLLVHQK